MTKRFLMTSALIGSMAVSQAFAASESPALAAPKLTISGQSTFNAWWYHNDRKEIKPFNGDACDYIGKGRGYLFTVDDSRLKFDITGKTDPGMDYGFTIVVDADTDKEKNIKENYLFFGGSWGKLTMGDVDGVEDTMAFYGGDPLGGTGGFDGNFDRVMNFTTGSVVSPDLVGDTSRSTKIIYHTPRWKGLQAGVSYTPRTQHRGQAVADTLRGTQFAEVGTNREIYDTQSFAGGLNFINKFNNGWELALSGTFIFGDANSPCKKLGPVNGVLIQTPSGGFLAPGGGQFSFTNKFKDTAVFALGFLNSFKGFEWGGELGWNGRSHEATRVTFLNQNNVTSTARAKDSWFIDTGLGYTWGATKLSAGYFYGQRKAIAYKASTDSIGNTKARTHIFSTSLDHKLAPGVLIFGEYAHYNMKNKGAPIDGAIANAANGAGTQYFEVRSGKSNAFVVGTKIKF